MIFAWNLFVCLLLHTRAFYSDDDAVTEETIPQPTIDDKIGVLTADDDKEVSQSAEKHEFQAEIDRMMKLITNSLYKNKEIFLRELVSNASDALEKIEFLSIKDPQQMESFPELGIWIRIDKEAGTVIIRDSGIGMTKSDLIKNLGTLARSGTSEFTKMIQNDSISGSGDVNSLIGQFGVGFYSSFLVADKVTVISKHNSDDQYVWRSDSISFSISKDPRGNTLGRGTQVILHMREEASEYLEYHALLDILKKYSTFIHHKIYLKMSLKEPEKPKTETTPGGPDVTVTKAEEATNDSSQDVIGYKLVNDVPPLWMRKQKEITQEEYDRFYSAISKQTNASALHIMHDRAEGDASFRTVIFIPKTLSQNFFGPLEDINSMLKLYVRRVYISEATKSILPRYLWFLVGVVDSDDLPLNVGRETLQQSPLNKVMKKRIVRKFLDEIRKLPEEKFTEFYSQYGICLKMGVMDDEFNRNRLMKLVRFQSSHHPSNLTTFMDYISRMKKNQQEIFFIAGSNRVELEKSPLVQKPLRRGYEVLFMVDTIDEYMMQHVQEFEGKRFQSVAKDGFKLQKGERATKRHAKLEEDFKPLFDWFTASTLYKDEITSARVSERTDSAPCLLISDRYSYTGNMHRIVRSQTYNPDKKDDSYKMRDKKHLEVNPKHPLAKEMLRLVLEDKESEQAKELAKSCMSIASLASGYTIDNTLEMANLLESLTVRSLGIDPASVQETIQQETEEEIEDEEEDEEDLRKHAPGASDENKDSEASVDSEELAPESKSEEAAGDDHAETSEVKDEL